MDTKKYLGDVFDVPFDVYRARVARDENGIERQHWEQIYHLYGQVTISHGREYELARQEGYHRAATIRLLYGPRIEPADCIMMDGKWYDVEGVEDIRMGGARWEVIIRERTNRPIDY